MTFDFLVTNTGNIDLTNILVTDDVYGEIGTIISLAPNTSQTLTVIRTAQADQHVNVATATAAEGVSDSDPGNYFGVQAGLDIEKLTNGEDADNGPGPYINTGNAVFWTYHVTNTGNVTLTDVIVTDDRESALIVLLPVWNPVNP